MFDYDKWQEILHTLRKNKLRTLLTAFGVFWGVFMLVIMLGAGKGLQNAIYSGMGDFATNSMFVWAQPTTMPYDGFPRNRYYSFKIEDMEAIKNAVSAIDVITPTVNGGGWRQTTNVVYQMQKGAYEVKGIMSGENKIDPVDIYKGRYINEIDNLHTRKVILIGYRVYEELFAKGEDPVNKYVKLNGIYFKVIGVFKSRHTGGWGEQQNSLMFIPFTTTQQIYNYPNNVDHFSIVGKPDADISQVESSVKAVLARRHGIHPDDKGAFGSNNVGERFKKMNGLFLGIRGLVWFVGVFTLLAGVIGVSNIMLIIIRERTQEIGIKRAVGAKPVKIISMIISESVFLTSIAGLLGMATGIYLVSLADKLIGNPEAGNAVILNPEIDIRVAITAVAVLVVFGMLAGIIPARRAVSIKPIEAIHDQN
ncbi:MAG: FtsX-like permease family protein [Bacteroidetes bacterium]|jgi:putative ABC transport system permease protein|nr:FtsX-like permease family protein [Bacteroidota bacterium]